MGHFSEQLAHQKAVGDPGNDFGGVFRTMLGGGRHIGLRSTAELLAATASSPWPHLATVLIAIREGETVWELFRPGTRSSTREHRIHKDRIGAPAMTEAALKNRSAYIADLKTSGFLVEQKEHPFLEMLRNGTMGFPEPLLQLPGFEVASLFSTTRQSVGEFYFLLDRMGTDVPRRWLPLPPQWVQPPTHGQRNYHITMSRLGSLGSLGSVGDLSMSVPPEEMAAYRRPNPTDPYFRGKGSAHAFDHDLVIDENAATHLGATFQNAAVPRMLMIMAGLTKAEQKELEENWRSRLSGPWKAGMTEFLRTPKGVKLNEAFQLHELEKSPMELEVAQLRRHERDLILQVSQVPPLTAGVHESGNRAMALVAEKLMDLNAVVPARTAVRNFYQSRFFEPVGGRPPEYGPGWILNWNAPGQVDEGSRDRAMANAHWHYSRKAFLEVGGQQPLPGDEFIYSVPANMQLYDSRTGELVGPPPVASPGPFGASATPDAAKLEHIEQLVESMIATQEVKAA